MPVCNTIEQMQDYMSSNSAFFQEKIVSTDSITNIHNWLLSTEGSGKESILSNADTIYLYLAPYKGYLVEFIGQCHYTYIILDPTAVRQLMFSVLGF